MRYIYLLLITIFFTACSVGNVNLATNTMLYSSKLNSSNANLFVKSCKEEFEAVKNGTDMLSNLKKASSLRCMGDFNQSNRYFDLSEKSFKSYNENSSLQESKKFFASALLNDSFVDYDGQVYDGVLLNTYKALNFISLRDFQNARVEFNRALDRQRRAIEYYQEELKRKQGEIRQNKNQAQKTLENKRVKSTIDNYYSNLEDYKAYPDFINPFTTYMAGLFFMLQRDYRKAEDLLKESYAMNRKNSFIKSDLLLNRSFLRGRGSKKKYVWVIFENGASPYKKERIFNLPVFTFSKNIGVVGIALPNVKSGRDAFSYLSLKNGSKVVKSKVVADMNSVIKTEFKKDKPYIIARAITNAISKAVIQKQAGDKGGLLGALAGAVYAVATNRADTRVWNSLPNRYEVAKIELKSQYLDILSPNGVKLKSLILPKDRNSIVFVKYLTGVTPKQSSFHVVSF